MAEDGAYFWSGNWVWMKFKYFYEVEYSRARKFIENQLLYIQIMNIRQREIEIFQTKTRCGALPIHPITHTGSSIIK